MPIFAKSPTHYATLPEGKYRATLASVEDQGIQDGPWGARPRLKLTWEVQSEDELQTVTVNEFCSNSLYAGRGIVARLRSRVEAILGRPLTPAELAPNGLDLESLLGRPVMVTIRHEAGKDSKVWPRVQAVEHCPF